MRDILRLIVPLPLLLLGACASLPGDEAGESSAGAQGVSGSGKGPEVVIFAMSLIDTGYRFGGKNPEAGLDCSGMVSYIYDKAAGVKLEGSAAQMAQLGRRVDHRDIQPGDLVFFNTLNRPRSHVGRPGAGYTASVLVRAGDPLVSSTSEYRNDGTDSAASFQSRFGDGADGVQFFGLGANGRFNASVSGRALIAVNHELLTENSCTQRGRQSQGVSGLSLAKCRRSSGRWESPSSRSPARATPGPIARTRRSGAALMR